MVWKCNEKVHFASDSRLTVSQNSYADVGIKICSIPVTIYDPVENDNCTTSVIAHEAVLGMCFAGSAVNSLTIKESVSEVLKNLQHAPGYTDISMNGISRFIFKAYQIISEEVSKTALGSNGLANILIGGYCSEQTKVRVFYLSTDSLFDYSITEVLTDKNYFFIGSGREQAESVLPKEPTTIDYINVLKSIADDVNHPTVGGNIQYGCFNGAKFIVYGVAELKEDVHYYRGGLDLNSNEFIDGHDIFVPGIPFIDFFPRE